MERGTHWWNEPPLWAWITMVVGAVALAVMLPVALNRSAPAADAGGSQPVPSGSPTSTPSGTGARTSATPAPDGEEARVVVIGDGYASGTPQGGLGPDGWPALLEERIEGVRVDVAADEGAGYVASGGAGLTFRELAESTDLSGADVVVVLGSRDDPAGVADQVAVAARAVFGRVAAVAPEAELVVVGPVWPEEVAPAGARNNRDVVRAEAEAVGALFLDPLEDGWLVDEPDLLGSDGVYPTAEGHAYLADRIEPAVRDALGG